MSLLIYEMIAACRQVRWETSMILAAHCVVRNKEELQGKLTLIHILLSSNALYAVFICFLLHGSHMLILHYIH